MTKARDLASSGVTLTSTTTTADAALARAGGTMTGDLAMGTNLVDGVDVSARDAVLTDTTTKAIAALPKTGGAMTGAITTNSTFDGVDIATRDAVLSSTTTTATNALNNANNALPKEGGVMTGPITTNSTFDGVDVGVRDSVLTSTTTTANAALPKAGGAVTGNVTFGDGNIAKFGTDSDMQIFHNGSSGTIRNSTGTLVVRTGSFRVLNDGNNEQILHADADGAVSSYFNNAKKFETTNTGVAITGGFTATTGSTITVAGSSADIATFGLSGNTNNPSLIVKGHATNQVLTFRGGSNTSTYPAIAFDMGTSGETMRIASSGNVGINTTAPQRALSIGTHGTTSAAEIAFGSTTTGTASLLFGDSTSGNALYSGYVQYQHNGDYMLLATSAVERMRINSTGIAVTGTASSTGTFSPSNSNWTTAAFKAAGAYGGALALVDGSAGYATYVQSSGGTYVIAQGATSGALTTRVQINGSGHLIVGSASHGDDNLYLVRSGTGKMLRLYSGSSEVGAMGSLNTNNLTISGTAADHGGLQFGTHCVLPMEANADSNATIDLGGSGSRFKDLYLSGGAFIGGTSAANKLDDYEYGTWNGRLASGPSGSVTYFTSNSTGYYVKIGKLVHFQIHINNGATGGSSSQGVYLTGLPFTASYYVAVNHWFYSGFSNIGSGYVPIIRSQQNTTGLVFQKFKDGVSTTITYANFGGSMNLMLTGTYYSG